MDNIQPYKVTPPPLIRENDELYLQDNLRRIETAIKRLIEEVKKLNDRLDAAGIP